LESGELAERVSPWYLKRFTKSLMGVPGSIVYNALVGGNKLYYGYVLKKKEAL